MRRERKRGSRIVSKLWQLRYSKRNRLNGRGSSGGGGGSKRVWFLAVVSALMIVVSMVSGIVTGLKSNYMLAVEDRAVDDQYVIDGYKITFLPGSHPEMEGNNGFVYPYASDDIYIRKGLDLKQLEETCNHELMHNLGLDEDDHWFVEGNDEKVDSDICNDLVEVVRRDRGESSW